MTLDPIVLLGICLILAAIVLAIDLMVQVAADIWRRRHPKHYASVEQARAARHK